MVSVVINDPCTFENHHSTSCLHLEADNVCMARSLKVHTPNQFLRNLGQEVVFVVILLDPLDQH